MPGTKTQTGEKEEAIPCPNVYGEGKGEDKCVVCGCTCPPMEMDDGMANCDIPVWILVCSPKCLIRLDQNHRSVYDLPDFNHTIETPMDGENVTSWRIDNGNGAVFTENGKKFLLLTAYHVREDKEYIPRAFIELSELLKILAKQKQ